MIAEKRTDPKWVKSRRGNFHRLLYLKPDSEGLAGVSGVYVVWHGGLKPEWITVGKSTDLNSTLEALSDNDDIEYYEKRGGVFVTWSQIKGEYQDGVLRHLIDTLDLLVPPASSPGKDVDPIPVFPPG